MQFNCSESISSDLVFPHCRPEPQKAHWEDVTRHLYIFSMQTCALGNELIVTMNENLILKTVQLFIKIIAGIVGM